MNQLLSLDELREQRLAEAKKKKVDSGPAKEVSDKKPKGAKRKMANEEDDKRHSMKPRAHEPSRHQQRGDGPRQHDQRRPHARTEFERRGGSSNYAGGRGAANRDQGGSKAFNNGGRGRYFDSTRGRGTKRSLESRQEWNGPRQSPLGNKVRLEDGENDGIVFFFGDKELVIVESEGQITVNCSDADRTEESLQVCNMILRPLALQIISQNPHDPSSQWYLTDGKDYKVKVLENFPINGPKHLDVLKHKRAGILKSLHQAKALYADLANNSSVTAVANSVTRLFLLCAKNNWLKPKFIMERMPMNQQRGFVYKVLLPQFGMEIAADKKNWDSDTRLAKNKAALAALKALEALQGAGNQ